MIFRILLTSLIFIFVYMNIAFLVSLIFKRNDIADTAWGLGFIFINLFFYLTSSTGNLRQLIVLILIILWGLRLATYIYFRNKGKPEDFRYKEWKEKWGKNIILKSYLKVFIIQGFFMFLISIPSVLIMNFSNSTINLLDYLGISIWIIGFIFETVGDWQMYQFKKNILNKGKIMNVGLWNLTRHPNYFGEVTMWWGIFLLSLSVNFAYIGIIGPLTISYLILKVSGIPLLEKKYEGRKDFEEYKNRVSAFLPLPPKKI